MKIKSLFKFGEFKITLKEHSHFGKIGVCIDIINGNPALFKLEFNTGEIRGFTPNEIEPILYLD